MSDITIAIIAAPNVGKTTLFNRLTGAHQTVGNWGGVTIEKRSGRFRLEDFNATLVDLPGTYSVSPTSAEEHVVQGYLQETPPELLLTVVDAGNLYRGLGLVLQLAHMGLPIVVAVNMMDEARRQGMDIDFTTLQEHLGVPVVPIVATTGEGVAQLQATMAQTLRGELPQHPPRLSLPAVLEEAITDIARQVGELEGGCGLDGNLIATRLLESDQSSQNLLKSHPQLKVVAEKAACYRQEVEERLGTDVSTACAQCRFNAARGLLAETTRQEAELPSGLSERLDSVLLHRWLGLPMFFLIMFLLFQAVFLLAAPLQGWLGDGFAWLQGHVESWAVAWQFPAALSDFLVHGLIEGVGVVMSFFPVIALFFIFISLIEDTGYIARAAFLMDRVMHLVRLDGKAFVSLLFGYGCNVPAIMGTRILSSRHNRVLTMLLVPFSVCSARLQVFLFLATVLFAPSVAPWVVFGMYVVSFALIFLVGLVMRPFRFGSEPEPFVMELPPFRPPAFGITLHRAWREVRDFLKQAATLIVLGVTAVWALTHLPTDVPPGSIETWAGQLGSSLSPIFEPLGIHWQETVALMFGLVAKEVLLGALAILYGGEAGLEGALAAGVTPLEGLSFMVFALVYTPCVATLAVIRNESRSWRVTLLSVALGLSLGWVASFMVYQGGLLLGFH